MDYSHEMIMPSERLEFKLFRFEGQDEHYCVDENLIRFTHDEKAEDRQLTELIRGMYEIYEKKEFGYELLVKSLFYQLQYILVTKYRDYLRSIRLEYAREELIKSDKSLGEIALMHGFPNNKAFANAFKKQYQILPSEFRKRNNRLNK